MKAMLFLRFLDCCRRMVHAEGEALIRGFCRYGQMDLKTFPLRDKA